MTPNASRRILRYRPAQRFVHWMGASGFILLLLTGIVLLWPPLSSMAAGGVSRMLHRLGLILYLLWPVLYAILDSAGLRETIKESVTFTHDDIEWFKHMPAYFFGRTRHLPPQGRVNAGQKLHHIGVVALSIFVGISGFVLMLGPERLGANGLAIVAMVHDLSMLALTVLLVGHLYFTFVYGGLSAMTTGYVSEEYARMEHAKWLASVSESTQVTEAPAVAQSDAVG
jgi:formate dehydrogenase subunit gamma